jgi:hypothetical protein
MFDTRGLDAYNTQFKAISKMRIVFGACVFAYCIPEENHETIKGIGEIGSLLKQDLWPEHAIFICL